MPSWKKVLISGSDAALNTLNITTALTASGLIYPASDGTSGQGIVTDGNGNLSFTSIFPTASFVTASNVYGPVGANSVLTASYALTSSYNVNPTVSGSISGADWIDFVTGSDQPIVEGRLGWDSGNGTLALGLKGGNVTLQVGQEQVARVYNADSIQLTDGMIVYISGSQGNRIAVKRASANAEAGSSNTLGMVTEPIPVGQEGFITTFGTVNGLNTLGLTPGAALWLNSGSGEYTQAKPNAPYHNVLVGYVQRVHETVGSVFVKIDNGYEIDELHNVEAVNSIGGDLLVFSGSVWHNTKQLSGSYGLTGSLTADSFVGELTGTASYASNANLLDGLNSTQFLRNDQSGTLTGDLTVTGIITAQEFHTELVSSSIIYQSGSTQFGDTLDDIHTFTGSVNITGSVTADSFTGIFVGALSSSAQIATDISGAFTSISSSIATDISNIIDGTTTVTSASYALTASYIIGGAGGSTFPYVGAAVITGSLTVTGSYVDFTQVSVISGSLFSGSFEGDGSGLTNLGYGDTKKLNQTVAATTWSFSHNMNEQYPTVTVYNSNNEVIQPSKIEGVDAQTLRLYFGTPTAGTAVAVVGGVATTQEAGFNRILSQTVAATTWSFAHNLGQKYPQLEVYDVNDELIIPGKVQVVDQNNAILYFDTPQAGTVAATVGGTAMTASYSDTLVITDTLLSSQTNTDVDTGTETIATVLISNYDGAFFDYVAKDGTNFRAGTVMSVWDGSSVQFNDNSTTDIGDTSGVVLSVDISGTDARLRATVATDNWTIKAFVRAL